MIIPSQNAIKYSACILRRLQYAGERDAIVVERSGDKKSAEELRLQAHDLMQVATFLEDRLVYEYGPKRTTKKTRKNAARKGKKGRNANATR